jgi:prepilin-type N-terminal cleavage/methylation domain-containing protein
VNVLRRPDRRLAGFTLVELLVSMAVLALVALTMMSGMRFVFRAFAHTDERRVALEELTLGLSVLRSEIERAEPLFRKVGNRDFVLFEAGRDRVRFANAEPPYRSGLPYLAHEVAVITDSSGYRIEVRRAPLDPARPDLAVLEQAEPRVLLRVPRSLQFTYYGKLKERDRPSWHEEWPRGQRLPQAVRLADGEEPGWPELVVPLMNQVPWYCGTPDPPSSAGCSRQEERPGQQGLGADAQAESGLGESGFGESGLGGSGLGESGFGGSGSAGSGSSGFGQGERR